MMLDAGARTGVTQKWMSSWMYFVMAVGLFLQISGKVWLVSGSARNTQIYLWLILPAFMYFTYSSCRFRSLTLRVEYYPWFAFLAWVALSSLWGSGGDSSISSLMKRGVLIAFYLGAIYLLLNRSEVFFRRAICAGLAVVAMGALASLVYQYGVLGKSMGYRAFRIDRMGLGSIADFGWPVAAGIFHGAIAVWAFGIAIDKRSSSSSLIGWLLAFLVLTLYVVMTGARGAWVGLVIACGVSIAVQRPNLFKYAFGAATIVIIISMYTFWDKILVELQVKQLSGRGEIWAYYFTAMTDHWLFGYGLGTPFAFSWPDKVSPHAHSLYLQQIYDSGLVSLSLMLVGLWMLFLKSWRNVTEPWVRLALPALTFALVAMLTDVERIFTRPGDYWTLFWLPVGILLAVNATKSK